MRDKKLLILDTFFFLHRSFHAFPLEMKTSTGLHTNVVFGFAQTLLDSILEINPTHVACAWESEKEPSFRKELFPEYQADRKRGTPEEEKIFRDQLPIVIDLIKAFNIPRLIEEGFEGDDIIGTVAARASGTSDVIISTADQDLLQLVDDHVMVYRPARPPYIKKQLYDKKTFLKQYGFSPAQMIEYKALRGDPSDNIPGVKGVGDKTAKVLLKDYPSIEILYSAVKKGEAEISPAVKKRLLESEDLAFLSKRLVTIVTDIPLKFDLDDCVVHDFDVEKVRKMFDDLEFKSLHAKLNRLEAKDKIKKDEVKKPQDQMSLFEERGRQTF